MECCFTLFLCLSSGDHFFVDFHLQCWHFSLPRFGKDRVLLPQPEIVRLEPHHQAIPNWYVNKFWQWLPSLANWEPVNRYSNRPKPVLPFQDITSVQLHNLDPKKRIQIQRHPQAAGSGPWVYLDCGWEQRINWGRMPRKDCFPVAIMSTICLNFGH